MESWEQQEERKGKSRRNKNIERQTPQGTQPKPGCSVSMTGCLYVLMLLFLTGIIGNEYRRSKIRLEQDKLKLEQAKKDRGLINKSPVIIPDTLKIGNYQKEYIPLLKMYQERQKD